MQLLKCPWKSSGIATLPEEMLYIKLGSAVPFSYNTARTEFETFKKARILN